jgi:ABC-type nitrate/sulfonate/bicarbonate transport system substrate-binding protein
MICTRLPKFLLGMIILAQSLLLFAQSSKVETIRIIGLPSKPLPVAVAESRGIFSRFELDVQFESATTSDVLRSALAEGKADVAHAAVDNAVAMVELNGADVIVVIGGEGSINELIAQPEIHSISELKEKTVIVDAPNTAFALQLKKILLSQQLQVGRDYQMKPVGATPLRLTAMREHKEYAASMLGPPTSILAKQQGFVSLGSVQQFIGAYQGIGGFVGRQWAKDHSDLLVRYLAAYIEAQRWILAPENKQQVTELLAKQSHLPERVAVETYAATVARPGGFASDARLDLDGFRNVLQLRAEVEGQWAGHPPSPEKYYDLSYYGQALSKMK